MIKFILVFAISLVTSSLVCSQQVPDFTAIDMLLVKGDYKKVADTCSLLIRTDSMNAAVHYRLGLAYQNLLNDDRAIKHFKRAVDIDSKNMAYNFTLSKLYFNKGKTKLAEPVLKELHNSDTLNWPFAFYLTSIYMQTGRYDKALDIYFKFLKGDSLNYLLLDRIGFAYLRKGSFDVSKEYYNRSLQINNTNTTALKNLSYLYASTKRQDTAVVLLTRGIEIDPSDLDLYDRRAQINYLQGYTRRALDDYLFLIEAGDSTAINLKRAGIGYTNNLQPGFAVKYLLWSYRKDSTDFETASYLGQCYNSLNDIKKSIAYYNRVLKLLKPVYDQTGLTYTLLAETQRKGGLYNDAIRSYLKSQEFRIDPNIYMIIANVYDEQLDNKSRAIQYYQLFLDSYKKSQTYFPAEYIEAINSRLEYLKTEQKK
jgi:tetratricopeptide (TPR) repeat protein